jgi:hypothetical protein
VADLDAYQNLVVGHVGSSCLGRVA